MADRGSKLKVRSILDHVVNGTCRGRRLVSLVRHFNGTREKKEGNALSVAVS